MSLPAIPYPNGKYYKFIAKVFPITEEEGAKTLSSAPASRPRKFARDYPDSSGQSVERAICFLQSLAEGRDPDTNAVLDPTLVLSRSYEAWFRFAATLLGKLPQGKDERKFDNKFVYLLQENISKIELSDAPVTARRLGELVNAVREPYGKKLTAVAVGAFFLEAGLTEEEMDGDAKFPQSWDGNTAGPPKCASPPTASAISSCCTGVRPNSF